jgi:hypothetical protein
MKADLCDEHSELALIGGYRKCLIDTECHSDTRTAQEKGHCQGIGTRCGKRVFSDRLSIR